ncbi:MAG: sulfatase [Saprospiraceae bacterium]|nr:sulfatase [Saprospiraceae bacterium]
MISSGFAQILLLFIFFWGSAQKPEPPVSPNILLIFSDDLNTQIGPYNALAGHTPHLDQLAEQGVQFNRAYCQFPLCGPSRASVMSGLYPETNGVLGNQHVVGSYRGSNPDLANHPSIAGFFREQGYFTARVSKIFHMGVPGGIERGEPGDDDPDSWDYAYNIMGPETLSPGKRELLSPKHNHYGGSFARIKVPNDRQETQTDYMATTQAIALLESRAAQVIPGATNKLRVKKDAPFFLAVGLVRPHLPFIAPETCYTPYPDQDMQLPLFVEDETLPVQAYRMRNGPIWGMDTLQQKQAISGYLASVRFMDQQIGRLLHALDRLALSDNTIVVFLSDHGFLLGEHDSWQKTNLWEGTIRVPMIIADPRYPKPQGRKVEAVTELIDLYPTLADLAGLSSNAPTRLQGQSLAEWITQITPSIQPPRQAYSILQKGATGSLRSSRWHYIRWGESIADNNEALFDTQSDPEENQNLAQHPEYKEVLNQMRDLLDTRRAEVR